MYYLNPLPRGVLITPDEVIKQSSSDEKLDPRKLLTSIEIAEERFVRTALGWDLYEAICAQKNTIVTSGNIASLQGYVDTTYGSGIITLEAGQYVNATDTLSAPHLALWNNRLWKYIAECVRFVAMPEVYANLTSQGIMKNHPTISAMGNSGGESASVSLADVKWLMDKWIGDRIDVLETAIHTYICRNAGDFGLYGRISECTTCANANPDSQTRRVGWITSIYDDDQNCGCSWT